ncbi:hypothetical protein KXQ82_04440 [Mucilaginibacter sp. HMF5004]|uniref:MauE/DoxX family redox-associated membrane protein n=1 Tax=Mucilaginibacter rivuli TaxID=2857527 RepID=UPI001C5FF50A|nr:MauE/DoxX family redox-associated membrane protein [Mucilaginibacter rivuli]MBW4888946.1 hypothetical protein [Mucilaginibacter rivuli]
MKKIRLSEIITFLFILLFAYTAVSKFLDHNKFVFQMRLAPLSILKLMAPTLGWIVPVTELLIAIALLSDRLRLIALYFSVVLLITFEVYIAGMLLSGHLLPCTCGGIISKMSWKQHLIFNAGFIILAALAIDQNKKSRSSADDDQDPNNLKDLSRA